MKAKKQERKKLSFAVDREEIEINSDWVSAVMGRPPAEDRLFFAPDANNATVENPASVVDKTSVVENVPVAVSATVEETAPPANDSTVERKATVAESATASESESVPVVSLNVTTVEQFATASRKLRPKPIRRITDGLTPGQFAVYSLMFENGMPAPDNVGRLYRGGYADLCSLTGLSKRGIQNIVAELQQKTVISVFQAPGYHRTQMSVYRVPPQESVVEGWTARGFRFAIGKSKTLIQSATVAA